MKRGLWILSLLLTVFCFSALAQETDHSAGIIYSIENQTFATDDLEDSGYLAEAYLRKIMPYNDRFDIKTKSAQGTKLKGTLQTVYTLLKKDIVAIAAGGRSLATLTYEAAVVYGQVDYTASDIGVSSILDASGNVRKEAQDFIDSIVVFDMNSVVQALMVDCPYELYWYDKTAGFVVEFPGVSTDGEVLTIMGNVVVYLHVSTDYALDGAEYQCDTTFGQSAQTAAATAQSIVDSYAESADLEKLNGYANEICALTSYNSEAAAGGVSYGNPWQLIWVFDGNPNTNVVCEGYAKAFQYLCDLTTFTGNISVITVTGTMNGGTGAAAHMWNIVNLDDGNNYLVDVTNIDEGTVGYPDQLMLAEFTSGSFADGYIFATGYGEVSYVYDEQTRGQYAEEEIMLYNFLHEHLVAYGFTNCGQTWFLYDDGLLYISGTGSMTTGGWDDYLSDIKKVEFTEGITAVGGFVTLRCMSNLEEIILPDSMELFYVSIDSNPKLQSIILPDQMKELCPAMFAGDIALETVVLPEGLLSIGNFCFDGCTNLTDISIPSTVEMIGDQAFRECKSLRTVSISQGSVGRFAFVSCSSLTQVSLADGVTTIGEGAFSECTSLESIHLPSGLDCIEVNVFGGCTSLSFVELPASVTQIGEQAFVFCSSLQSIVLPDGLVSIDDGAFMYSGLTSIMIPDSVDSIGTYAFADCHDLAEISLGQGVTDIGNYTFRSCGFTQITLPAGLHQISANCFMSSALEQITIDVNNPYYCDINGIVYDKDVTKLIICPPGKTGTLILDNGVREIGELAFAYCKLSEVQIPDSVNILGEHLFESSAFLETLTLPIGVTAIPTGMCNFCTNLKYVNLPETLLSIGEYAFRACGNLSELYIPSGIEYIGNEAFASCNNLNITIASDNQFYDYRNGMLLSKDGKTLHSVFSFAESIIHIPNGVQIIASKCFTSKQDVLEVYCPDTVTSIESEAFSECGKLRVIGFGNGLSQIQQHAFSNCTSITSVNISSERVEIQDCAFFGCTSLKSVNITGTVTNLGGSAFYACTDLASVSIGRIEEHFGAHVFTYTAYYEDEDNWTNHMMIISDWIADTKPLAGQVSIPNGIIGVASYAFYDNNDITAIICPSTLRVIDDFAFSYCTGLTDICLNQGLVYIGQNAFSSTNISSLRIPDTVRYIGYCFLYNSGIVNAPVYALDPLSNTGFPRILLVFEGRAPSFDEKAFINIGSAIVFYPYNNASWNSIQGQQFGASSSIVTTSSGNIMSYDGVIWIPYIPSTGSTFIPKVTLPTQLSIIDENAFENCMFESVKVPEGTSEIRAMAFANCRSLTQIYIPNSVQIIADSTFTGSEGVMIIGNAGSEAETFALNNGFQFVELKDMKVPSF